MRISNSKLIGRKVVYTTSTKKEIKKPYDDTDHLRVGFTIDYNAVIH